MLDDILEFEAPIPRIHFPIPEDKSPMAAYCGSPDCSHVWVVVWLPMQLEIAAKVMQSARCPLCASSRVMMASPSHMLEAGVTVT